VVDGEVIDGEGRGEGGRGGAAGKGKVVPNFR
jgi:hypothetical protein